MSTTNRSNNRAGNKANNSGSKSSAQTDGSKGSGPKSEKQLQEELVHALKPDWTQKEIEDFCKKFNYDGKKINDALENAFQDERPGHQDTDWQEVSHKRTEKKKAEEEKSPVSARGGRGGFPGRGGRGAGRGGAEFTRGGGRGRGGARGGAIVASNGVADGEVTSPTSERGGRGRGRGGPTLRGGRGAARGGRVDAGESKEVKESSGAPSAAPVPAPLGAWASKPSILGAVTKQESKSAASSTAAPAPAASTSAQTAAATTPAAAAPATQTTQPATEAPAATTSDAQAAPATSPAAGSSLPARKQRPRKDRKEPAATVAGDASAAGAPSQTSAASSTSAAASTAPASESSVNFGSVGSGSLGVSVAAPEQAQSPPATTPSSKQQQDPIGPSRRGPAWRVKGPKAESTTPTAAAPATSPAASTPVQETTTQPQGFSISHTSFPTEPVEMPRAIASVSHGYSGVSFGFDAAAARAAAAASKAVAAPAAAAPTPATSAFSSPLGTLPTEFSQPAVSQPAPLSQKLGAQDQAATTTTKRASAGAVGTGTGAASTQASQATQTFGAQAGNLYSQAAGAAGVFGQQVPQSGSNTFRGQYTTEQYMAAGYDDQSNTRSLYNTYDQNYGYAQPFQQGFYGQATTSESSPRGPKPTRGTSRQQQGLKKDDGSQTGGQGQQAPQHAHAHPHQQTESSSPQVGPVDAPSSESPVPTQQQAPRKPRQQQQAPQMQQGGYEQGYPQQKPQQPYGGQKPYNPNKQPKYRDNRQGGNTSDPNLGPSQFPALGAPGFGPSGPQTGYGNTGGKNKSSPQQQNYGGGNTSKFNKNNQPQAQQQQPQQFSMPYGMPYGYYAPPYGMPYGYTAGPQSPQFAAPPYAGRQGPYGYPGYAAFQQPFPGHVSPTGFEDYSKDYPYPQQDMMMQQGVDTQNGVPESGLGMAGQDNQGYDTAWQGQWQPQQPMDNKPSKEKSSGAPSQGSSSSSKGSGSSGQRGNSGAGAGVNTAPTMPYQYGQQQVDYTQSFPPMYQGFQPPFEQQQQQQQQRGYGPTQWNA